MILGLSFGRDPLQYKRTRHHRAHTQQNRPDYDRADPRLTIAYWWFLTLYYFINSSIDSVVSCREISHFVIA